MTLHDQRAKVLLREIVSRRAPSAMREVDQLGVTKLSDDGREALREIVADELVECGLDVGDEPNQRGRELESVIDWLGRQ